MRCPFCSHEESGVRDSRLTEAGAVVRRRRICPSCDARWTTFERVQLRELVVIKRSGRREDFDRDKLVRSMQRALAKRNVDPDRVSSAVASVCRYLESIGDTDIPSARIGDFVLDALRRLDPVAYVRFASVYREFVRADDFARFLAEEDLA